ncbi:unnamed protein product [Amoebophrya sp. A120]|nr:unnamed protein product [Amoebophrya sp. A120]|eukprot:GSA120T00003899001.1
MCEIEMQTRTGRSAAEVVLESGENTAVLQQAEENQAACSPRARSSTADSLSTSCSSASEVCNSDEDSNSIDDDQDQDLLFCPITMELFRDPVVIASGNTYDRVAIERHFKAGNVKDPLTNQELPSCFMITNWDKRRQVQQYLEKKGPSFVPEGWESRQLASAETKVVVASRANAIAGTSSGTRTTSLDWYVVVLYTLCAVLVGFSLQTFASVTLVIRYPTGTNSGQQFLAPRDQSQRDSLSVNMRRAGNSLLSAFYRVNHNGIHEDESAEYEPETSEANENEFYQNDNLERRAASGRSFEFDTASDFAVRENSYLHEILFSEATIETNGAIGQSILSTNFTRSLAEDEADEDHEQHGTSSTTTPDVDFQEDIVTAYSAESSHPFLENPVHIAAHFLLDHGDSPHLVNFALSYLNQLPDMVFNAFLLGLEEAGNEENTAAAAKRPSTVVPVPVSPVTEKEENAQPVPQATSASLLSRRNTVAMRSGRESSVYNQEQSQPRPSNMTTTPALLENDALPAIEVAASGEQNLATVVPTTVADNEMDKSIADWIDEVVETKLFSAMERYGLTTKEVAVVTWRNATQAGRGFEQNRSSLVSFEAEQDDLDHESTATEIPSDSEAALQTAAHGNGPRTILDAFADQMAGKKGQHYKKYEKKTATREKTSSRDAASSDPPLISAAFTPFEKQLAARSDLYFNVPISHMAHAFVTGNNPFAQAAVTTTEKKKKSSCPARWCGNMFENYNGKKKKQDNKARGQEHHERVDNSFNIVPSSQNGWGVVVPNGASSYSHQSYYSDSAPTVVVSGRGEDAGDHVILNKKTMTMKPILLQASIQNREDSYRRLIEHVIFEQVGKWIPENLSMVADVLALSVRDLQQVENATAASGAPFLHVGHDVDVAEEYNYKFWSVYIKTIHSSSRPDEQQRKLLAQQDGEKKKFFGGKIRMRAPVEASSPRPERRPSNYIESAARVAVPHSMFWRGLANSLSIMHRFAAHPTLLTCLSQKTADFLTKIQHFATTWRKMVMVTSIAADAEGVVPDSLFNSRSGHYADLVLELVRAVQERRELSCGRICGTCIAQ